MLAASAIVSAGLITSAVLLTQPAAPPPLPSGSAASQAAAAIQTPPEVPAEPVIFARGLVANDRDAATLGDLITLLEETTGQRVIVPYAGIASQGSRLDPRMTIRPFDFTGLTVEQGLDLVGTDLGARPGDTFVLNTTETALELAPQSFFDRRDAVLIEYDIRDLLYPPAGSYIEPTHFADTIVSLIELNAWTGIPQIAGPRARMGVLSTTMIVSAHPRIHAQIEDLFARIEARYEQQRADKQAKKRQELAASIKYRRSEVENFRRGVTRFEADLDLVRAERDKARARLFRLSHEQLSATGDQVVDLMVEQARVQDEIDVTGERLADLTSRLARLRDSIGQYESTIAVNEAELAAMPGATD